MRVDDRRVASFQFAHAVSAFVSSVDNVDSNSFCFDEQRLRPHETIEMVRAGEIVGLNGQKCNDDDDRSRCCFMSIPTL